MAFSHFWAPPVEHSPANLSASISLEAHLDPFYITKLLGNMMDQYHCKPASSVIVKSRVPGCSIHAARSLLVDG